MKLLSPGVAWLIDTPETPELGPGPRAGVRAIKEIEREVEAALRTSAPKNKELALAVVLLWHDHLDAAHEIAQEHETQDGSYVHAIMHRREPDYGNAKYWFRRVGRHPCYAEMPGAISASGRKELVKLSRLPNCVSFDRLILASRREELVKRLGPGGQWDAMAFVDACAAAANRPVNPAAAETLREIQANELRLLLKHLSR